MLVHEESNSLLLKSRDPQRICRLIPRSKLIKFEGHNVAVRYGMEETKVLRNLGMAVPSPIMYRYHWPSNFPTIFEHQRETAAFATLHSKLFILNEQGTCKTSSALWAADFLMREKIVRRVLIVAPLSTLERAWRSELFTTLMHRSASVLHGSRQKRLDLLAVDTDFYIINHDGISTIRDELRKRKDIDLVIVDEAGQAYRNGTTKRYKDLKGMLRPEQRLWLMTGTPCPNAPTDAWALARLVNPNNVPMYFNAFKRQTMYQISTYKWLPKPEAYEIAYQAMQPAIRYKKSECLDLPPLIILDRECELTKEQKEAYSFMRNQMVLQADGTKITAVNAADQITKLRQILCGVVKVPNTDEYKIIDHHPRVNVLKECIAEAGAKVIVIVPFKGIIYSLQEQLKDDYSTAILNGDVPIKERNEILRRFKEEADPHVLLCHPKVMSHGLTLTEADTMVFYAPIYSNDEFQQVKDRINRPGQTRHMTITRMGASALEWSIYKSLDARGATQNSILDLYKHFVVEET